jgi:tRNA wybutosine-synthesizing protein 1
MTGYQIVSQQIESRVVLLSRLDKPVRVGKGCVEGWERERARIEEILDKISKSGELDETEYRMVLEEKI